MSLNLTAKLNLGSLQDMAQDEVVVHTHEQIVKHITAATGYKFKFNSIANKIELEKSGQTLDLNDGLWGEIIGACEQFVVYYGKQYKNERTIVHATNEIAHRNTYNPIKHYLTKCLELYRYNPVNQLDLLLEAFGVADGYEKHADVFLSRWLHGCVARVFRDFQNHTLIIQGLQGKGKSTFFKKLCSGIPRYYIDEQVNLYDKDHTLLLANKFIWTIDEFGSTLKSSDRNKVKAFLTKNSTEARAPYARHSMVLPRMCSHAATVNDKSFLTDETGNRRYLVLPIESLDWETINEIKYDMLWGEIYSSMLEHGEAAYVLSKDDIALQAVTNSAAEVIDPLEELLQQWLEPADPSARVWNSDLYKKVSREPVVQLKWIHNKLPDLMQKLGYERYMSHGKRGFRGVAWKEGMTPQENTTYPGIE